VAVSWTRCPLADCDLVALVEYIPMGAVNWQGGDLVRVECIAGHARLLTGKSIEINEVKTDG
jgi:hypothetical protein